MEQKEYIILDFGKVIAGPAMENWFITPNFWNIIDKNKMDLEKFNFAVQRNGYFLDETMYNESDEFMVFSEFYRRILSDLSIPTNDDIIESIADDWTFNDEKFKFYPNIKEELEYLREKYRLLMLTDNWPSVLRILHNTDIRKYFERVYISSMYSCKKSDGIFFDFPIIDYDLYGKQVKFVDDSLLNLDMASKKGLTPILMDRDNEVPKVKYKKIDSLFKI